MRFCAAVVCVWVVFLIWRAGLRIVSISVGIVEDCWRFGIEVGGRRLWLMGDLRGEGFGGKDVGLGEKEEIGVGGVC